MKICRNCGTENAIDLNFCGECGTKFPGEPQMVVPLDTVESLEQPPTERITESFGEEPKSTETVVGTRFQDDASIPTFSAQQPQASSKTLYWLLGGCLTLLVLAFIGIAGFLYVNWESKREATQTPEPEQTPVSIIEEETPESEKTPDEEEEEPEETPELELEPELEDPESKPKVSFTPPTKPTRQGSFSVKADEGWQTSEIDTVPSEIFRTSVRGKVYLDGIDKNISANGISGNRDRRIYKKYRTGALLMRTRFANGKVGNIMPATQYNEWQNYPNERGRLEFLVNDNSPEKNKGEFVITVRMVSVPKN